MLFTRVRDMPHIALERWLSLRGVTLSWPLSSAMATSSTKVQASWPLGPFTVTVWPSTVTLTPDGTATGFFPIRDILVDPAEDFAADIRFAGGGVRHHALGRGKDRDAEAVLHRLQVRDG